MINGSYGSSGSPQDNCLQNTAAYFFTHRKLFLNGQNMLTVDHPIPRNEAEFSVTLFGMTGSPIMLGDALDRIAEDRLALIKKVLPRPADWPFPADLFKRVYPDDYARVLAAPVRTGWGDWTVAAVFNLDERTAATEITLEELRLPGGKNFRVWDFGRINTAAASAANSAWKSRPNPAGCCGYRLWRWRPRAILATDMHVRAGSWNCAMWPDRRKKFCPDGVAPGRRQRISQRPPAGNWRITGTSLVAKDARDSTLVIRRAVSADGWTGRCPSKR